MFHRPRSSACLLVLQHARVAISNRRLIAFDRTGVTLRYKDYRRDGSERQSITMLTADEFSREESGCIPPVRLWAGDDEVERALSQFGGGFGGAVGPIRGATARTSDILPVTASVAELLHPDLDLGDRVGRLVVRLAYGAAASAVDLARVTGAELTRGDYCRLAAAGLVRPDTIRAADEARLLECLDDADAKLCLVRQAANRIQAAQRDAALGVSPILKPYEGRRRRRRF